MSATDEAAEAFARGLAARNRGDLKGALSGFLVALALAPSTPLYRREALAILGVTSGYKSLPEPVLDALRGCALDPALDIQPLALVVRNVLENDPRLAAMRASLVNGDNAAGRIAGGTWDWFLAEPLLHAVLARATAIGSGLEAVFTALRRHALLDATGILATRYGGFLTALALQANTTRFAWLETPEETARLDDGVPPLIRALYRPLRDVEGPLPEVLSGARRAQEDIRVRAGGMALLTEIDDAVSRLVQAQYEHFPYPPWDALGNVPAAALVDFLAARFPHVHARTSERPRVLSAGCGTGRGAIMLALMFPEAEVTALDLSRPSLAYAALKADQHGARNISFGVGDILKVAPLGPFDLIECAGVLHHMADPAAGLAALCAALSPGGVMRLALYSARGRKAVMAARELVRQRGWPDSDAGVRRARHDLLALPPDHPARGVVETPEFHTLDGLHDLIFNVQESRTSPREIKAMLDAAGLAFLGFDISDARTKSLFARAHPHADDARDLDKWEVFEQEHPETFAEMYQFWCHKPADPS